MPATQPSFPGEAACIPTECHKDLQEPPLQDGHRGDRSYETQEKVTEGEGEGGRPNGDGRVGGEGAVADTGRCNVW